MMALNLIACFVIFIWSGWAILSPRVKDGILGKVIFACIALSAMGVACGDATGLAKTTGPGVMLHVAIAALGARHIFLKHAWPAIIRWYVCAICPFSTEHKYFKRRVGDK